MSLNSMNSSRLIGLPPSSVSEAVLSRRPRPPRGGKRGRQVPHEVLTDGCGRQQRFLSRGGWLLLPGGPYSYPTVVPDSPQLQVFALEAEQRLAPVRRDERALQLHILEKSREVVGDVDARVGCG